MQLTQDGDVHIVTLNEDHQVLNDDTMEAWETTLHDLAQRSGPGALVITGTGKSFHQGLDLTVLPFLDPDPQQAFLTRVHRIYAALLRLPMPTVSAINGHAQAGGAMLALSTDVRIMRGDRGWFRLPEVELKFPFTPFMDALIAARVPQPAVHRLMVLGQRFGGAEAAQAGIVDTSIDGEGNQLPAAIAAAAELAPLAGPTIAGIRSVRYADVLALA